MGPHELLMTSHMKEIVRQDAADFTNKEDENEQLDFEQFRTLIRQRETGEHSQMELEARFKELDANDNGLIGNCPSPA